MVSMETMVYEYLFAVFILIRKVTFFGLMLVIWHFTCHSLVNSEVNYKQ